MIRRYIHELRVIAGKFGRRACHDRCMVNHPQQHDSCSDNSHWMTWTGNLTCRADKVSVMKVAEKAERSELE
jgi:hypothetical protein